MIPNHQTWEVVIILKICLRIPRGWRIQTIFVPQNSGYILICIRPGLWIRYLSKFISSVRATLWHPTLDRINASPIGGRKSWLLYFVCPIWEEKCTALCHGWHDWSLLGATLKLDTVMWNLEREANTARTFSFFSTLNMYFF